MPQNNIPLETAQNWAREYRKNPANTVFAHLIPRINLVQLLACPDGNDVRAYIGIDDYGQQKLMFVSVDASGKDLLDDKKGQLVYDNSAMNPPNGDICSMLYTF